METSQYGLARKTRADSDQIMKVVLLAVSCLAVLMVFLIIVYVVEGSWDAVSEIGILDFLLGNTWSPDNGEYGALPLITGTILVTIGAMAFAVPIGLAAAIYISENANKKFRNIIKPVCELFAGIPSVVYGFFGLIVLVPFLRDLFPDQLLFGNSWLAGSLVLGIMALPTIISVSEDAIHSVPQSYREASLAMGATRWETTTKVVVPAAISGISDISIGDTLCSPEKPEAIPFQKISEPTIAMQFIVNDSPFAGQEGKYVTSRHLRDRLFRELNTDVSLRVEEMENTDSFKVSGRGELHLSVLIENMRREGYEFAVSKAEVLYHTDENGKKLEPMELAYIDVPDEFTGVVIEKLGQRKGELRNMGTTGGGYTRLEFSIPSRGLIGYRGEFLTDTKGNGILNTSFDGYAPYKGDIQYRKQGSLIAFETGESVTYGLYSAQERGTLFIGPGEKVYAGMVIGQNGKAEDIELNVCKTKHLTNTRSSSADEALRLTPPRILSLEQALDFIDTDELLEVTPKSLRIRKKILDSRMRKRSAMKQ